MKNCLTLSIKAEYKHTHDVASPLLGIYPVGTDSHTYSQKYIMRMFMSPLFVTTQTLGTVHIFIKNGID